MEPPRQNTGDTNDLAWRMDLLSGLGHLSTATEFQRLIQQYKIEPPTEDLRKFLADQRPVAKIIRGPRGAGKTAHVLFKFAKGLGGTVNTVRAVTPFFFFCAANSVRVPEKYAPTLMSAQRWKGLWKLTLGMLFAHAIERDSHHRIGPEKKSDWYRTYEISTDGESARDDRRIQTLVDELLAWHADPFDDPVIRIIGRLVRFNVTGGQAEDWFAKHFKPSFAKLAADQVMVLGVDGIDEAFSRDDAEPVHGAQQKDSFDPDPLLHPITHDEVRLPGVGRVPRNIEEVYRYLWASAQVGFALAAHEYAQSYGGRLLPIGTMRTELMPYFSGEIKLPEMRFEHLFVDLIYTRDNLFDIFIQNVDWMAPVRKTTVTLNEQDNPALPGPPRNRYWQKVFFGTSLLTCRAIFGEVEEPFDAVARHTFHSPRGMLCVCREVDKIALTNNANSENLICRKSEKVLDAINEAARAVLQEHLTVLFPPWETQYEDGLRLLKTNILNEAEIRRVNSEFAKRFPNQPYELIAYLFSCGLVGYPQEDTQDGKSKLHFADAADGDDRMPDDLDYCALHPALSARVLHAAPSALKEQFYSGAFLVGERLPAPSKWDGVVLSVRSETRVGGTYPRVTINDTRQHLFSSGYTKPEFLLVALLCTIKLLRKNIVTNEEIGRVVDRLDLPFPSPASNEAIGYVIAEFAKEATTGTSDTHGVRVMTNALKTLSITYDGALAGVQKSPSVDTLVKVALMLPSNRAVDHTDVAIHLPITLTPDEIVRLRST